MLHGAATRCGRVQTDDHLQDEIERVVALALHEDRAREDVTSLATMDENLSGVAMFDAREPGIMAGGIIVAAVYAALDPLISVESRVAEGGSFGAGDALLAARGPARALLQGERVALNLLQRLCATASATARYVALAKPFGVDILDTRKTTPGLRALEKYAVRCGGGVNHRLDLASMAMIKDNHREALGRAGLTLADGVARIRALSPGVPVEVEIDSLDELEAALEAKPEWILLDNMSPEIVRLAVERTGGRAKLEVSGGVTLETVEALAEAKPDAISVGALTHSSGSLDIGVELVF